MGAYTEGLRLPLSHDHFSSCFHPTPSRDEETGIAAARRAFGAVETSRPDSDSDEEDEHRGGLFSDTESQYEEAVVRHLSVA